jgi:glycogen synthase
VVAPSQAMATELRRHYRCGRVLVVPNGRTPVPAPPVPKEPFFLSAGRLWDDAKNVAVLDEIAADLPWPVVIAGAADDLGGRRWTARHSKLLGELSPASLHRWMQRASVFVLPARYEPFGLSPLEAALAGCALVLGDIPSQREIWGDAVTYVPPSDGDALRTACTALAGDAARLASGGRRSAVRARAYTPAAMALGYAGAYRAATDGGAAVRGGAERVGARR